jgi:hypothetical protein
LNGMTILGFLFARINRLLPGRNGASKGHAFGLLMLRAQRSGGFKIFRLRCTGSEAGEYVISIGRKEIPECRPSQPRTCRPGPAAQHLSRAEPWLRIVAVGIWRKSWKWREVRASPFPNIANHLPATKGAVAARASRNVRHCNGCRAIAW